MLRCSVFLAYLYYWQEFKHCATLVLTLIQHQWEERSRSYEVHLAVKPQLDESSINCNGYFFLENIQLVLFKQKKI